LKTSVLENPHFVFYTEQNLTQSSSSLGRKEARELLHFPFFPRVSSYLLGYDMFPDDSNVGTIS
jgi:hypothetical protein